MRKGGTPAIQTGVKVIEDKVVSGYPNRPGSKHDDLHEEVVIKQVSEM